MEKIDQPQGIRPGEELDTRALDLFLRKNLSAYSGEIKILQFPSGFSNLTYLLEIDGQEFILRRPPAGTKAKTAHDMGREFTIMSRLQGVFPYAPKPLVYCEDPQILGAPFYLMERIKGIILRKDLPPGLELSKTQARTLFENFVKVLAELHQVDLNQSRLMEMGRPKGYITRQVQGWSKRYVQAKTPDAPDFTKVMDWLAAHIPEESPNPSLIHNDFKFDNLVLDPAEPSRIIGVLDWEMATVGDPLMDLGSSLGYWIQADDPEEMQSLRMQPTHIPGAMSREEFIACYSQLTGKKMTFFDFFLCFGYFRLAVIAQQIYYRYYHGQTKDKRFQKLIFAVHILERAALRTIQD